MVARLAVLVDGDNIPASHAARILDIARQHGCPDVARVYADAQRGTGWHDAVGYRLIHAGTGKNASDLLLAIDAMELAFDGGAATFVIASSDGDFTHLAQRLREYGKTVAGVGEAKSPPAFRAACSSFIEVGPRAVACRSNGVGARVVDLNRNVSSPNFSLVTNSPAAAVAELDLHVREIISRHSKKGIGMKIVSLGNEMSRVHKTRVGTLPEKTWRAYLMARPALYDLDPRGPESRVRLKPDGFSTAR